MQRCRRSESDSNIFTVPLGTRWQGPANLCASTFTTGTANVEAAGTQNHSIPDPALLKAGSSDFARSISDQAGSRAILHEHKSGSWEAGFGIPFASVQGVARHHEQSRVIRHPGERIRWSRVCALEEAARRPLALTLRTRAEGSAGTGFQPARLKQGAGNRRCRSKAASEPKDSWWPYCVRGCAKLPHDDWQARVQTAEGCILETGDALFRRRADSASRNLSR